MQTIAMDDYGSAPAIPQLNPKVIAEELLRGESMQTIAMDDYGSAPAIPQLNPKVIAEELLRGESMQTLTLDDYLSTPARLNVAVIEQGLLRIL
jgi:hypothetical protein